ncbi:MAG TPA: gliding motility-associated C-terminal domain-containing protein, partial [Cytophagales bacterium]
EGSYRWYEDAAGNRPAVGSTATGSAFTTPALPGTTTYYVSLVTAGCESARVPVVATVLPGPAADAGADVVIREGESTRLRATGGTHYEWWPASSLDNPAAAEPLASPATTTLYHVAVRDANGCRAEDTVRVTVRHDVAVPNAFTPNDDGTNDRWEIANIGQYPDCKVEIFNRWGAKVYESRGYATPWDGTLDGKPLPMTTYFYVIDLRDGMKPRVGPVSVIR